MKAKYKIEGSILIFTDIHFGKSKNSVKKLALCESLVDEICEIVNKRKIKTVLFLGDWFDDRKYIGVGTLDTALRCVGKIASCAKLYMIVGNHDMFELNSTMVNSINAYSYINNVVVISDPTIVDINGHECLLAPWLTNPKEFRKDQFKYIFGHFEFPIGVLKDSYIKNNIIERKASKDMIGEIESDELLGNDEFENRRDPDEEVEYINSVFDIFTDTSFEGHIHVHSEKIIRGKKLICVGSPWQQTTTEKDSVDGYYVLNADDSLDFIKSLAPVIKEVYISDIMKNGIDAYDYSELKNNVIKLIYDIQLDGNQVAEITTNINNVIPFDFLQSEYRAKDADEKDECTVLLDEFREGKYTLIENYMSSVSDEALKEAGVIRENVMNFLKEAFNATIAKGDEL